MFRTVRRTLTQKTARLMGGRNAARLNVVNDLILQPCSNAFLRDLERPRVGKAADKRRVAFILQRILLPEDVPRIARISSCHRRTGNAIFPDFSSKRDRRWISSRRHAETFGRNPVCIACSDEPQDGGIIWRKCAARIISIERQ